MNFQPLGERVIIERKEEATKTASGIIIPDNAAEKQTEGTVLAVSKAVAAKGEIAVGDVVVFGKYAGTEITLDGKEYVVLNNSEKNDEILIKRA
jgi:chaperonin GroES